MSSKSKNLTPKGRRLAILIISSLLAAIVARDGVPPSLAPIVKSVAY